MNKLLLTIISLFAWAFAFGQQLHHVAPFKCGHLHTAPQKSAKADEMDKYDVTFYFLDIEATNTSPRIAGTTTIIAKAREPLSEIVLELNQGITASKITVDGNETSFVHMNGELSIMPSQPIAANASFTVKVTYNRPGTLETDGIFTYMVEGWKPVTYTLSESFHARNWFPCKQDLYDKADSVYVFVTVDEGLKVGSNGLLTAVTDMGNNKVRYEWKSRYPIVYYLISIAIADYKEFNTYAKPAELAGDSILIQNYLYNNADFAEQKSGMVPTGEMIEMFSEKYSLYPFWKEKYGHSYVPLGGAMEHQTMTSTGSHLYYIIAHELGHQWFGDNVTCGTWQDIWINEGFASYSEYLAFEFLWDKNRAASHLEDAQGYAREATSGSVYVPFEDAGNESRIFSWRLTYRKGLCLVHMIREEINNDELFFKALQDFQMAFADSAATGDDFQEFISNKTGIDFTSFFEEWYYGEGYPIYKGQWGQENGHLTITLNQSNFPGGTPFFTNTVPFKVVHQNGDTLIRLKPTTANETFTLDFAPTITDVILDPESAILKGDNSYFVDVDEKPSAEVTVFPNPFTDRIELWGIPNQAKVIVVDINGRKIDANYNTKNKTLDTTHWPKGLYALVIEIGKDKIVKKIVKE